MNIFLRIIALSSVMTLALPLQAAPASAASGNGRANLEVTVYTSNIAMVKDRRTLSIPKGRGLVSIAGVPSSIIPETVSLRPEDNGKGFRVLEKTYDYDLLSEKNLLDKYIGKTVKLIRWNEFQDRQDTLEAELLSNAEGPVYRIGGEIYLGYPGIRVLPALPEGLVTRPTLSWLLESATGGDRDVELSYLAEGMTWRADYRLVMTEGAQADLSAWITIDNRSGASFTDAAVSLIAGNVNRVQPRFSMMEQRAAGAPKMDISATLQEQPAFEYHRYDIPWKTSLEDRQTKQILLFESSAVDLREEFLVMGSQGRFQKSSGGEGLKEPATVSISFGNRRENNLGMPLPGGAVRLFKRDSAGRLLFIGEDRLDNKPAGADVRLTVGAAFDVTAERKQKEYKKITSRLTESQWEITLNNQKEKPVTVGLIESFRGNWKIIESNRPFVKIDAFTARFDVTTPAGGSATVTYRLQTDF